MLGFLKGWATNFGGGREFFGVKTLGKNWTGDKFLGEKLDGRPPMIAQKLECSPFFKLISVKML